ncbi:hypothetical protein BJX99DRAFT_267399 [Aspergillus californicus]
MAAPKNSHIIQLPATPEVDLAKADVCAIADTWIAVFGRHLSGDDAVPLHDLFHQYSWWRDMLAVTWDFRTIRGIDRISEFISTNQPRVGLNNLCLDTTGATEPKVETPVPGLTWITALFSFETEVGHGNGVFYLTQTDRNGPWKAYAVYTALQDLKVCPENVGKRRPEGTVLPSDNVPRPHYLDQRQRQVDFQDSEPTVLIVGAGQSGLSLAARLEALGQSCLIVERHARVGDNWRKRYKTLVLHDHAETCHMAYLPFPKTWPKYSPKDKLADWLESYATIMELNIWPGSEVTSAVYSENEKTWTVAVVRDGVERSVRPRHIAWCAGHLGIPKVPSFPGQDQFEGEIYHTSRHDDAAKHACKGKNVVVVGTGTSGHDIAEDYCRNGAHVTMLQRGPTYVVTEPKGLQLLPENFGLDEDGTPLEIRDILSESLPWPVTLAYGVDLTKRITEADRETIDGLLRAGFKINLGTNEAGILRLIAERGGGYYIDVGCSQLIIDGSIKLKYSPGGIASFEDRGILLADGDRIDADIVVLATGYENMHESVRRVLGDHVADRCKQVWGLDEEGEINTIWRPSGHPGFWFMGGALALCRIYSRFVALQIAATEHGLV